MMNKPYNLSKAKTSAYFLWDYDLDNRQIRKILHGSNEVEKQWLVARILTNARFKDVWKYLSIEEIVSLFPRLRLRTNIRKAWQRALRVWGYEV